VRELPGPAVLLDVPVEQPGHPDDDRLAVVRPAAVRRRRPARGLGGTSQAKLWGRIFSTATSRCSSPMPDSRICPVSGSARTAGEESPATSRARTAGGLSWTLLGMGSAMRVTTCSGGGPAAGR